MHYKHTDESTATAGIESLIAAEINESVAAAKSSIEAECRKRCRPTGAGLGRNQRNDTAILPNRSINAATSNSYAANSNSTAATSNSNAAVSNSIATATASNTSSFTPGFSRQNAIDNEWQTTSAVQSLKRKQQGESKENANSPKKLAIDEDTRDAWYSKSIKSESFYPLPSLPAAEYNNKSFFKFNRAEPSSYKSESSNAEGSWRNDYKDNKRSESPMPKRDSVDSGYDPNENADTDAVATATLGGGCSIDIAKIAAAAEREKNYYKNR